MAKKKKDKPAQADAPKAAQSVLAAAWEAYSRGDMVTTRRLANEVLAERLGADDRSYAETLGQELSSEGALVGGAPRDVALELIARTRVPVKSYAFAGVALCVFVMLVSLAVSRAS